MSSPPRVLAVSSHGQLGGSELYLARLLAALGDRIEPRVVVLQDGPLVARLHEQGVDAVVVETGRRAGLLAGAVRLRRIVRRERPDLVHANGVKAAAVAALALAGGREPMVWVKHDHSRDGGLARTLARRAARVVGVSRSAVATLGGAANVTVVPTGVAAGPVDRAAAAANLRAEIGAHIEDPVLIAVGRLDPAKGFDLAVDVLARVRQSHPAARLVVVGGPDPSHPGVDQTLVRRADAAGVGDAVHLLGGRTDAVTLLAGADVLLVTSRAVDRRGTGREGFGLVAAEAVLVATPVVGFADGATPEVVGDAGLLVPPGDVDGLAARAGEVLDDAEVRARLAAAARERAPMFDVGRWADAVFAVYAEVGGSRGGPSGAR
jgi:glycosyltransferase involved in cell wall biosynthesis